MDILSNNYDEYLSHLFIQSSNVVKKDTFVCYYDSKNYYFKIQNPDDVYYDEITGEQLYGLR